MKIVRCSSCGQPFNMHEDFIGSLLCESCDPMMNIEKKTNYIGMKKLSTNLVYYLDQTLNELERAEKLHPHWPDDIIHQVAIMVEEAGESMRAALNHVYDKNDIESVREELIQCGAMVFRCLINLEE